MVIAWLFLILYDKASVSSIFSSKNAGYFAKFVQGLLGTKESVPAFRNPELIKSATELSLETMWMSILAIGIATTSMLLFLFPATAKVMLRSGQKEAFVPRILDGISQFLFIVTRSVPELLWAMIFVFVFNPGILPGALALAVHNFGVLGKLCSEVIENMDLSGTRNLAASGASNGQQLIFGIFPELLSKIWGYILYRWEVIIRSTIIVGFVGAGGLGEAFRLAMSFFHYSEITLYMICYLILVYFVDIISSLIKKQMRLA